MYYQPNPFDGVRGGQGSPPIGAAVLGGLAGVRHHLTSPLLSSQVAALIAAYRYGPTGIELLHQVAFPPTPPLATALSFLKYYGAEAALTQWLCQGQPREFEQVLLDDQGQVTHRLHQPTLSLATDLGQGVSLEMVPIPGGSFLMGSPETEEHRGRNEGPQHWVTVSPFYMGRYPVTQAQWRSVAALPPIARSLNPEPAWVKGDDLPVVQVSWRDAGEFCDRLTRLTCRPYRLPREAEWEYACRAGTTTPFHFGSTITPEFAHYDDRDKAGASLKSYDRKSALPIGSFQVANSFGLFDMHGNVWEWCADALHPSYDQAPTDARVWGGEEGPAFHVMRGGSWTQAARYCRSAARPYYAPEQGDADIGFRIVCG